MRLKKLLILLVFSTYLLTGVVFVGNAAPPVPLLEKGQPVNWWFVFKFNARTFPGCGDERACLFGGTARDYGGQFSQQFVYASSKDPTLHKGAVCLGATTTDPVGATFDQVYNGSYYYVLWNDQFHGDPLPDRSGSWGHSKGLVAWDDSGEGFVMQVSTPSWPGSGTRSSPRPQGNTLGCVERPNNIQVSQHFFAVKLTSPDLRVVLAALLNTSVVTDPSVRQLVRNGGPADVQAMVVRLGKMSTSTTRTRARLSSGVDLISKPSRLCVPPWQMVSAALSTVPLRVATWWTTPKISSTTASTPIGCWPSGLGDAGPVEIAVSGQWEDTPIGLEGGPRLDTNHAKIGVSADSGHPYTIFGDLNQQGALSGSDC